MVAIAVAVAVLALQVLIAPPASAGIAYRGALIANGPAALYHPLGVAGDGEGNIYVADTNNHRIVKFGPNGAFIRSFGRGSPDTAGTAGHLYYPAALTYANGDIYVADTSGNDVQVFTTDGTFVTKWGQLGQSEGDFNNPDGITADCDGNIYVADPRNQNVQLFSSSGQFKKRFGLGELAVPVGVATAVTSPQGCYTPFFLVADEYAGKIAQYRSGGDGLVQYIGTPGRGPMQFDHPDQIAVDSPDPGVIDLWVAESGSFRIQQIRTTDGGKSWHHVDEITHGEAAMNAPHGVAVDGLGRIIVANTGENEVDLYKLEAPKLTVQSRVCSRRAIKDGEGLLQAISYNQLDKNCNALVKTTLTVPPHAEHVFTVDKSVTFTNDADYEVALSSKQVRWLKQAWRDDRNVAVAAEATARCAGNVHVTDKVHYFI